MWHRWSWVVSSMPAKEPHVPIKSEAGKNILDKKNLTPHGSSTTIPPVAETVPFLWDTLRVF
jgi:hypothetical protein